VEVRYDAFEREVLAVPSIPLVNNIRQVSKSIAASREWRTLFKVYRGSLWKIAGNARIGDAELALMDMFNLVGEKAKESGLAASIKNPIWYGRQVDVDEDLPGSALPPYPNLRKIPEPPDSSSKCASGIY
jgi:hypothetical protein